MNLNRSSLPSAVLPLIVSLALAGCSLAPDYHRPDAPIPSQYPSRLNDGHTPRGVTATAVVPGVDESADLGWHQFFRDPQLKALIVTALANNRDMRIAVARVQEAHALYGVADADRYPSIGMGANAQIQHNPESVRQGGASAPKVSRYYQAGLGLTAFELDFFGRIKNLSKAAYEQFLATAQARRTVHINLIAQVAEAYFNMRAAEQQHVLVNQTLDAREKSLSLVQSRYDAGVASALDLNQAKSQLLTVQADLSSVTRIEAQAQNALLLLLGESLPDNIPKAAVFGQDQLLSAIPVGLPSALLERRPDIMGAENNLLAANANIGAARAAFFPNISITGLLGFASPALGGLFGSGNHFWSFSPSIQAPLFAGGGLSSNLDLAKARNNIAVSQYEKTIQTAFREVADALAGEATYSHQLDALRSLEDAAARTLELAQLRYDSGIDSFLQVQTAQIALYSVQLSFLQTGLDSLTNRVELYKALGGGWVADSNAVASTAQDPAVAVPGEHGSDKTVLKSDNAR